MNTYRFNLLKGSKKLFCWGCGEKSQVPYVDSVTKQLLPEQYGRCDREINCGYHFNPYQDGYAKMIDDQENGVDVEACKPTKLILLPKPLPKPEPVFIPNEVLKSTLDSEGYVINTFLQNLLSNVAYPFEALDIERVIALYLLGTVCNGYRHGAITFPYIDSKKQVRAIQVKQFNQANHTTATDFLHTIIEKQYQKEGKSLPAWLEAYQKNELKVSCMFGEHLLEKYPHNPVALVEAPKTAIYGTLYFGLPDNPQNLLWLGVYNLSSLTYEKCKVLKDRSVFLFPDLAKDGRAYKLWSAKASEITQQMPGTRMEVSDILERSASDDERASGLDLADFLIQLDWRNFRSKLVEPKVLNTGLAVVSEKGEKSEPPETNFFLPDPPTNYPYFQELVTTWDISSLETFFTSTRLPTTPIKLDQCSTITNVPLFIKAHLETVQNNNGKHAYLPYLERLRLLKSILNKQPTN